MKKTLLSIILLLGSSLWAHADEYAVKTVLEGDRILLTNGQTVHLLGIDAEKKQAAREFLTQLVQPGQAIEIVQQGRTETAQELDAYVYTTLVCDGKGFASEILHGNQVLHDKPHEKSIFLNGEVLKRGFARPVTEGLDPLYAGMFATLTRQAKEERLGIWGDGKPKAKVVKETAPLKPIEHKFVAKEEKIKKQEEIIDKKDAEVKAMIAKYRSQEALVKTPEAEKSSGKMISASGDWERKYDDLAAERDALIKERDSLLAARQRWAEDEAVKSDALIRGTEQLKGELATAKEEEQQIKDLQAKVEKAQAQYDEMVLLKQENKALFDDLKRQHASVQDQLHTKDQEIKDKEALIKAREDKINNMALRSDALEEKLSRVQSEKETIEDDYLRTAVTKEKMEDLQKKVEGLQEALSSAKETAVAKEAMEERLASLEDKLMTMQDEKATMKEEFARASVSEEKVKELEATVEALEGKLTSAQRDVEAEQARRAELQGTIDNLEKKVASAQEAVEAREAEQAKLKVTIEEMEDDLASAQKSAEEKEDLALKLDELRERFEASTKEVDEKTANLNDLKEEKNELAAKVDEMEVARKDLERKLAGIDEEKTQARLAAHAEVALETPVVEKKVEKKTEKKIEKPVVEKVPATDPVTEETITHRSPPASPDGVEVVREYSPSGVLLEESHYKGKELHGPQVLYYDNGNVFIENNYKDGRLDGLKKLYTKDGELEALGYYENGVLKKRHNVRQLSSILDE